jgi:hypothetical protein
MSAAEPFFCVVMHHERKWTIEATWPDESVEVAETFADYFEALGWLGLDMGRETIGRAARGYRRKAARGL